jgi:uncharacterized RDD family membrane protein YckC
MEYKKPFEVTTDLHASVGQRFGNYLIDLIVQILIMIGLEIVLILICNYFEIYSVGEFFDNTNRVEDYLIGAIMILLYYIPIEIITSRSVGKFITGTIIVLEDGTKPDAETIIKRTFCRLIPFDGLSFLGSDARGWHDSMSYTYVVNKNDLDVRMKQHYEFDEIGKSENID